MVTPSSIRRTTVPSPDSAEADHLVHPAVEQVDVFVLANRGGAYPVCVELARYGQLEFLPGEVEVADECRRRRPPRGEAGERAPAAAPATHGIGPTFSGGAA